jgi:hypothetical protein
MSRAGLVLYNVLMSLKVRQRTLLPHARWKQLIVVLKGWSGRSFLKVGYRLQALVHDLLDGVLPWRMASLARVSTSRECVCERIHSHDNLHDRADNQPGLVDGQDPSCYQNNNDGRLCCRCQYKRRCVLPTCRDEELI